MTSGLKQNKLRELTSVFIKGRKTISKDVLGEKVGFLTKIFGCGHQDLSRPFSNGNIGYRVCLKCGARRQFNPETLETFGSFYYAPLEHAELTIKY